MREIEPISNPASKTLGAIVYLKYSFANESCSLSMLGHSMLDPGSSDEESVTGSSGTEPGH